MEDPDYALDIELIKKRAISGVVTFTVRTFFIQAFTFIATFALTVLLAPSIFGIFFIVSSILNLFVYFSDVGLAAALVQKKEEPTRRDLATTFTVQQIIILTLVTLGFAFSSKIAAFYNLDRQGLLLLRVLIFSLILSSLKTIPSILLERKLDFTKLVIPQIAENVVFYSIAVILALMKFQVAAFTWAVLARGVCGLIIIYVLSPWKPQLAFHKDVIKKLTSFGIPFQLNSILALIKDDLLTLFIGKLLPFAQVGYVGWAEKWAYIPLNFFMDSVNKITFPAYSRLQDHRDELSKAIEKSLFFVTYFVYPSIFGMIAIAPGVIGLIPHYQKWAPAVPLLYLFGINALFSAVSTTFTNTLFALSKPKVVLGFMAFWTAAIWVLTYPLVIHFGYLGVGIASALVSTTSIATVYFVKKEVDVNITKSIIGPFVLSSLMFIAVKSLTIVLPQSAISLIFTVIFGAVIYVLMSFAVFKESLVQDAKIIIKSIMLK